MKPCLSFLACCFVYVSMPELSALAQTLPTPQPGIPCPWEAGLRVSTHASVNLHNGNLLTRIPLIAFPAEGPDVDMALYHNSASVLSTDPNASGYNLGPGWTIAYCSQIIDTVPNQLTFIEDHGRRKLFTWDATNQEWDPPLGVYEEVEPNIPLEILENVWVDHYRLTRKDQTRVYFYDRDGVQETWDHWLSHYYNDANLKEGDGAGLRLDVDRIRMLDGRVKYITPQALQSFVSAAIP